MKETKRLPDKNTILITKDGYILIDEECPLDVSEIIKRVGCPIICG